MPAKQDRMIAHIVESEMAKGKSKEDATAIAYGHLANMKKGKPRFFPKRVRTPVQ